MDDNELAAQWEQSIQEETTVSQENAEGESGEKVVSQEKAVDAKPANFTPLKAANTVSGIGNLDFLLDISLLVSVHVGGTKMLIKDLLQLGQGSIIELNKMAGEPMDVLINDKLIARGEVVVVNDKFGVRLTDVMSLTDRVEQLK
ncbi:MAG: flagellar motor switch protein FliN [Nitrospirae bacterium]|nr:flagellar motor switch protein FliN [Nitrospirota bacterium]